MSETVALPELDEWEQLKRLINAASEGPWVASVDDISTSNAHATAAEFGFAEGGNVWGVSEDRGDSTIPGLAVCRYEDANGKNDAQYIAYANPERIKRLIAAKELAEARLEAEAWVSVEERLPDAGHYLVWVKADTKLGGYTDLANFGIYICEDEDCKPGDSNYLENNDYGNKLGSGWYREEDTHGGPYDTVFVDLNGRVTHYQPLPARPLPSPPEAPTKEQA